MLLSAQQLHAAGKAPAASQRRLPTQPALAPEPRARPTSSAPVAAPRTHTIAACSARQNLQPALGSAAAPGSLQSATAAFTDGPGLLWPSASGSVASPASPPLPSTSRASSSVATSWDASPLTSTPEQRAAPKPKLALSWAGAGLFFFWQLGAVKFLLEHFDLRRVPFVGASGGALASVLAACHCDPEHVLETAYQLSLEHQIWERPLGLAGVWGDIIERWLDHLLPDDAAERCRGRVELVVTVLPFGNQITISDFKDKKDLINVCMASSHVPLLLDWKMARTCRGMLCADGSFPDFFTGKNCDHLTLGGQTVMFDYFDDAAIPRTGRLDMLRMRGYDEVKDLMRIGYEYAAKLYAAGVFDRFDLADAVKKSDLPLFQGNDDNESTPVTPSAVASPATTPAVAEC